MTILVESDSKFSSQEGTNGQSTERRFAITGFAGFLGRAFRSSGGSPVWGCVSTAIRWIGRAKLGARSARAQGWRRGSRLDPHESFVVEMIEAQKDITLNEMVVRLANEVGLQIGRSALSLWLGRRGWTFKKRPPMHWSRSGQTS